MRTGAENFSFRQMNQSNFRMNTKKYLLAAEKILGKIKTLATQYRELTGKPLGVTGEIAEYEAIRLLGLEVCEARTAGYDAFRKSKKGKDRIQIKGRVLQHDSKQGQRIGSIKLDKEWDYVFLVMLDSKFNPTVIYQTSRKSIEKELKKPGSKARNERGQLGVSKFKSISEIIWKAKLS